MGNMKLKYIWLMIPMVFSAGFANAAGCDAPQAGFDEVHCFAKSYIDLDKKLTSQYQKLMRSIDPSLQSVLKISQRNWLIKRDGQCYSYGQDGGSVNMTCAIRETKNRIEFLNQNIAICRKSECAVGKLSIF